MEGDFLLMWYELREEIWSRHLLRQSASGECRMSKGCILVPEILLFFSLMDHYDNTVHEHVVPWSATRRRNIGTE